MLGNHDPLDVAVKALDNHLRRLCVLKWILHSSLPQHILSLLHSLVIALLALFDLGLELALILHLLFFFLFLNGHLGINLVLPLLVPIEKGADISVLIGETLVSQPNLRLKRALLHLFQLMLDLLLQNVLLFNFELCHGCTVQMVLD